MKTIIPLLSLLITFHVGLSDAAKAQQLGIVGKEAPTLGITEWLNLPSNQDSVDIHDFKGKVVYLYSFQSWCPGCHRYGFPTLQKLIQHYQDDSAVAFVAVQTAFEGFEYNAFDDAKKVAKRYQLSIPIGQSGSEKQPSPLMRQYRSGGTPWTVIVDPDGVVRHNDFHIDAESAIQIIDSLKP